MSARRDVFLVSDEPATASAVLGALESNGHFALAGVCRDFAELSQCLAEHPATLVLVDLGPRDMTALAELEPIIARFEQSRFLVLADRLHNNLLLEAMRIGARNCLPKPSLGAELVGVLQRAAPPGGPRTDRQGEILTLLSAGGGCGATTLAINLANEIYQINKESVLLVDLDASRGGAGAYLGLEGRYGLADVLTHTAGIDPELILSTSLVHSSGLRVLLSPVTVNAHQPAPLVFKRLSQVLAACRQAFSYVVIDAPALPLSVAAELAMGSRVAFLVAQLTVKELRAAKVLREALLRQNVPSQQLEILVNRCGSRHEMIALEEAGRLLEGTVIRRVGNDYAATLRALNYGQTLSQVAPRSVVRRDLLNLIQTLPGPVARPAAAVTAGVS